MMAGGERSKLVLFIVIGLIWTINSAFAQFNSPYSLQAAVDALHRREVQLALKDNYNSPPSRSYLNPTEQDYWDENEAVITDDVAPRLSQHKLNNLLAKYLEREDEMERGNSGYDAGGYDDDNYFLDERKRSFFRERDEKYDPVYQGAVFREHDLTMPSGIQQELTDEFLREIEQQRELERELKYKETLQHLWDSYQEQENEIKDELYDVEKQQKRFVVPPSEAAGSHYIGPLMQRKRSYPVLPWLPYSAKKKRFPVAKRSPKMPVAPFSPIGNDEKIAKDLQEIFGQQSQQPIEEKKKRSTNEHTQPPQVHSPLAAATTEPTPPNIHNENVKKLIVEDATPTVHETVHHVGNHHHHHGPTRSPNDSNEHEDTDSDEHDHDHDDEEGEDHDHDHDSGEDEDERKKKRSVTAKPQTKHSNLEVIKEDQIIPGDLSNFRKKKSIDWSQYFGIDRRKKSNWKNIRGRMSDYNKRSAMMDMRGGDKPKKRSTFNSDKLEQMDDKLKTIEDSIIDETIKYTGAHEGIVDPEQIRDLKDHVVSKLTTAYSLEKMRRNLEKLRQEVENAYHLERNEIDGGSNEISSAVDEKAAAAAAAKRLSVKKEKVNFDNNHHTINEAEKSNNIPVPTTTSNNLSENPEDKKMKQKKRNGGGNLRYQDIPSNDFNDFDEEIDTGHFEPHNDVYLGRQTNGPLANQCPIIDSMTERCRGVEMLGGDAHQVLLPVCGVHQLCYLCGTSQIACDLQFLSDADAICAHNGDCQSAARSVLMILRGTPGPQFGPKECLKNPCLYRVMREIGL